jgi:transcriptional regulator of acetoin/glycerol metabolism
VLDSWQRSRDHGIDPDGSLPPVDLFDDELEHYRSSHPLSAILPVVRRLLVEDADDCDLLVAISDDVGRLLWVEGAPKLRRGAEQMNFVPGARWSEEFAGTSAPGIALALDHAVQIFSHEHYHRIVQPWSCSAAPIHDPTTGRMLGILDVTGGDTVAAPQSLALVQAAVHAVENQFRLHSLRAPTGRRTATGKSLPAKAAARLDVLGRHSAVLHRGGQSVTLSKRHSEMLLLLSLNPRGLTGEELAYQLNEDDLSMVTVRAEMSRLRPLLGSLAPTSRPYRLPGTLDTDAAEVQRAIRAGDVARALELYSGSLLPQSQAPGIVRARRRLADELRAAVLGSQNPSLLMHWSETSEGNADAEVLTAAMRRLPVGSPQRELARLRLAAVNEEFGLPTSR